MAINANNFFNLEEEARTQGTLGGKKLTKEERKEAFKKQGKVEFKTFVEKVLNKKEPTVTPKALGGGATKALPYTMKSKEGKEKSEVAERVANAFDSRLDDLLKNIREDVGGILAVVEKQTDIDEEQAAEEKQENEKAKRKAKEEKSESKDKKPKTSGFLETLTKPVKGLWESIVGGFMKLLAGWGITKFLTWFGNPKNRENVEAFKEFVVNAVPAILKGILALVTLKIGLAVLKFVKLIALGSAKLLTGLLGLSKRIIAWAAANPWMAGAIGLGAATFLIGKMLGKDKEGENLAEAQNQSTEAIINEGDMDAGEADVLSQSVVTTDSNRMTDTNLRSNTDMLQLRNDPLGGSGFNKFNEGGFVSGPEGVDRVPAKLTAGEFVMSKGAVQEYGADTLANMNSAAGGTNRPKGNKFEGGGLVGNLNTMTKSKGPSEGGLGMTGGGKDFIGSDQKNLRFTGPKKEAYFLRVKKKTGEIQIWNEEFLSDKFVGSMDPNTKKIDYNNNLWGGAKGFEKDFFNKQKNKQMVLSRASNLIKKSSVAGEITEKKADQLINNPPGKQKKGKVIPVTTGGGGGGSQGGGGGEVPQEIMFSAIDKQNHYRSMVAAMCNILEDV